MKCCNNSEHIRFENLLKEGCEYKSKKKKINIRLSNKHLQNKWNSARFCCQKILAPDPIKCVAKYRLSQRRRTWCTTWWPHPTESAAYQCTGATTTNQPNRTGKKKKLSFWASFISYLVTNSICKLFVDVLFNHNTTFLNKGKEKQPFRFNSAAFIIGSRTVYARIRCEQTTAFELLKLLQ